MLQYLWDQYDENFDWSDARLESVKYSAGLMNILSSYFLLNRGRFVYLSSNEVFNNNYYDNISENEEVSPKSFKIYGNCPRREYVQ